MAIALLSKSGDRKVFGVRVPGPLAGIQRNACPVPTVPVLSRFNNR